MRTTIDLPDDLHRRLRRAALDRHKSMSQLATELIDEGLPDSVVRPQVVPGAPGLLAIRVGRPVTSEDVAAMEDEELEGW